MNVLACPACGDAHGRETGGEVAGFSERAGDSEFVQPAYSVWECPSCGLLYKTNTLTPAQLSDYYSKVDFRRWEIKGFFPTERILLEKLEKLPAGARILDFGCSSGRLLASLVHSHQCFGYEINETAAALARSKGLHMLSASELYENSAHQFDAIVLADVFEHLDAPTVLLDALIRLLRPGGVMMIATGNGDADSCRRDPAQFWYFRTLEHVVMLTRRHVSWLCERTVVTIKSWEMVSHYDLSWTERMTQYCQQFAYWKFRTGGAFTRGALNVIPYLRRASSWRCAPAFNAGKDHVVATLEKRHDRA